MANQAGPARAAGKLGPGLGRVVLGPRRVRIETRTGTVRGKRDQGAPPVDIELGMDERLVGFSIEQPWLPFSASLQERVAASKRKTIDWNWEAQIEVPLPPARKRAPRRKKGSS